MHQKIKTLVFLLCVGATSSCFAAKVAFFQLENGLKLLVKQDKRAPVIVSMVWYKIGSADEPGGLTGISHVLEHMMFKGTKNYPPDSFSKMISAVGGQENAFTGTDYTAYFEKLSAKDLALSFKLEADRMQHLKLTKPSFNKEINVVKEERRMRTDDNPQALTRERFMASAHLVSPYQHPVVGWMNDLENMTVEDAQSWYDTYYAPNNATIVVVGDVNPKEVYQLAKQYFGAIKAKKLPRQKPQKEPKPLGKRKVVIQAPAKLPLLIMGYSVPSLATAPSPKTAYALEVLSGILAGGNSARLPQEIIRKAGIAAMADVSYDLYARFNTQFMFYAIPNKKYNIEQLETALLKQVAQLQQHKIDNKELQRIKNQVVAANVFQQDSLFGQAMELGLLESTGLGYQHAEDYIKQINAITNEELMQVANDYLTKERLTIAILEPK